MRTARLAREHDLTVVHTLFPLHPDTPQEGLTLEALFGGRKDVEASHEQMARLMADEGLAYGKRTHTYNSRKAQELAKWAEAQPGGERIHDAFYRAYFVDGRNLADPEVLVDVVSGVGLDAERARAALDDPQYAHAVDLDWQRSRALGVTGVPTFVVGQQGVVGAQPYEVLERLVVGA